MHRPMSNSSGHNMQNCLYKDKNLSITVLFYCAGFSNSYTCCLIRYWRSRCVVCWCTRWTARCSRYCGGWSFWEGKPIHNAYLNADMAIHCNLYVKLKLPPCGLINASSQFTWSNSLFFFSHPRKSIFHKQYHSRKHYICLEWSKTVHTHKQYESLIAHYISTWIQVCSNISPHLPSIFRSLIW